MNTMKFNLVLIHENHKLLEELPQPKLLWMVRVFVGCQNPKHHLSRKKARPVLLTTEPWLLR